jgi:hypothetical protein
VLDFLLLMLIPTLIAIGVLLGFKRKITLGEFFGQIGVVALVIIVGLSIAYWGGTTDNEIWNGQITARHAKVPVSCSHSYSCNCSTDSKGHEHCDTCYEHFHDYDWDLDASTGETISISRVDRQGVDMPQRWAVAYIGEPFSSEHRFTNYIRANPESVLLGTKGDMKRWGSLIPKYPDTVYDYYHHDPVINMGVPAVDVTTWNWLITQVNKQLGPAKQVNVILILVPTSDRSYMYALKDAWLGGKKNDVDIVIGSKDGHTIDFAEVMSWSTNKSMAIDIKNRIQDVGYLDKRDDIQKVITTYVQGEFVRMHMKDMKWLMRSFQPSGTVLIILFILAVLTEGGLAYWSVANHLSRNRYSSY